MTNITVSNHADVDDFIDNLDDAQQKIDSRELLKVFRSVSGESPVMWGDAIIGFGSANLTYASGRNIDWLRIGFSPRKGKLSLYVTFDAEKLTAQFPKLGKYKIGKGCIYINRLQDVDKAQLEKLITVAWQNGYQQPDRTDGKEQITKII